MEYTIETYHGKECLIFSHEIASLRIQVFKEYPFLYDGNYEYEQEYLKAFFQSKESILIVARKNNNIVGVSTGIPLKDEKTHIQRVWKEKKNDIFYFSESVIEKEHRGKGLGKLFFQQREKWAKKNGYTQIAFCTLQLQEEDKRRPKDYFSPKKLWKKHGYTPTERSCKIAWKQHHEPEESEKELIFWTKELT